MVKMTFGIQEHQIKRINEERAKWNEPDPSIPGTVPDAILIEGFWDQLGREFGWAPFTLALHYMGAIKEQPSPRWVKSSEFNYEVGMPYHAKDSQFKGAGHFNSNGAFIWGDCTVTHPKDQADMCILDESASPAAPISINREWVDSALIEFALAYHKSANKDIANDAAEYLNDKLKDAGIVYVLTDDESVAGESDAVEFGQWIRENYESKKHTGWKGYGTEKLYYTTAELYELFKQKQQQ